MLRKIINGSLNRYEQNEVIESSLTIALKYLRAHYLRFFGFKNSGYALYDIALDAIAPLFKQSSAGEFCILRKAMLQWRPLPETEDDLQFCLTRLIINSVEQQFALLLKENDPFYSKILSNINYRIRKDNLSKMRFMGRILIVESEFSTIDREIIDQDSFDRIPASYFKDKNSLKELLNFLTEQNYFPAIPLNILIHKIKSLNLLFDFNMIVEIEKEWDILESIDQGLKKANERIYSTYFNKGKITREEAVILEKSLKDLAEDLKNGGVNPGLYKYILKNYPGSTAEIYARNYQNIFEYLYKVMKNTIAGQL
jgi:hypothetical protein